MNHSEECSNTHCDKKFGRVESGSERFQFGSRAAIEPALNVTDKSHHTAWPLSSRALYSDEGCELPSVSFRVHFFDVGVLNALARTDHDILASGYGQRARCGSPRKNSGIVLRKTEIDVIKRIIDSQLQRSNFCGRFERGRVKDRVSDPSFCSNQNSIGASNA